MFKRIAVHLEQDSACIRRIRIAIQLATEHDAELLGIYVSYLPPQYVFDDAIVPDSVYAALQRNLSEERQKVDDMFRREARAAGVTCHWLTSQGLPDQALALHSRCCDLLIMSQADPDGSDSVIAPRLIEAVIMSAGRPVLMVPWAGEFSRVGRRVLLCWDRGRESARALSDAAPILQNATSLLALTIDPQPDSIRSRDTEPRDFLAYCSAHGYPVPREAVSESNGAGIGDIILNAAGEDDCDLIVMGANGHCRLREWVMGGASRALLESMTIPTLFSH